MGDVFWFLFYAFGSLLMLVWIVMLLALARIGLLFLLNSYHEAYERYRDAGGG